MVKSFRQYLAEAQSKEYHYRIKTVEEMTEEKINKIEKVLDKYKLIEFNGPKKTIIQDHPLDFTDIENAEVYVFNAITKYPVSSYILLQELKTSLQIPEKFMVVRGDNEPIEVETERLRAMDEMEAEAEEKGYKRESLLSTEQHYPEAERNDYSTKFYGDEYNLRFKSYLANIAATRKSMKYQSHDELYDWTKEEVVDSPNYDGYGFNDHIKDAPEVVHKGKVSKKKTKEDHYPQDAEEHISHEGNFDDDVRKYTRSYRDPKGQQVYLSRTTSGIRTSDKGSKK